MDIENLIFESNTFEVFVASFVFCSVPDPTKGFKELKCFIKPDGRNLMLEYLPSPKPMICKRCLLVILFCKIYIEILLEFSIY